MATTLEQDIARQRNEIALLEARLPALGQRIAQARLAARAAETQFDAAEDNPATTPAQLNALRRARDQAERELEAAVEAQEDAQEQLGELRDDLRDNEAQLAQDTGRATQPVPPPVNTPQTPAVSRGPVLPVNAINDEPIPVGAAADIDQDPIITPPPTAIVSQPSPVVTPASRIQQNIVPLTEPQDQDVPDPVDEPDESIIDPNEINFGPTIVALPDGGQDTISGIEPRFGEQPDLIEQQDAARTRGLTANAQNQMAINTQESQEANFDWRVKLQLAPGADYLYMDPEEQFNTAGILYPLSVTNGVVFPYTPTIQTSYNANYSTYDLTHSNYRGVFYQNSYVDDITMTCPFTAQDTEEANYLLAVIHFFRSVTKMFYGQDAQRGVPPPLVYITGLGEFQFNNHPCVVRSFTYSLPHDVDYIRARTANIQGGVDLLYKRSRQDLPVNASMASRARLQSSGLNTGASTPRASIPSLGVGTPTYVPTKMEVQLSLLPIQTRKQVSQEFSLKEFANGSLLSKGFW